MSTALTGQARAAFERAAAHYDADTAGELFQHQRRQALAVLRTAFPPGCHVLDIGCGTGLDVAALAGYGVRVTASDPAEGMVARAAERAAAAGIADRVVLLACGLEDLDRCLPDAARFDGLTSGFGALNCTPHLEALGTLVARRLRPGGAIVLGLLGPACMWEAAYFLARGQVAMARRRRAAGPVPVPVAGITVPVFYHRIGEVVRALGPGVSCTAIHGTAVLTPPPYLDPYWRRLPAPVRRACFAADRTASRWPLLNRLGDHVVLTCRKARPRDV